MSIRRRLNLLEDRVHDRDNAPMVVILDGTEKPEMLRRARAYDGPLRIIRIGLSELVARPEDADARLAEVRAENPGVPITIVNTKGETLASWDPGLPRGLRGRKADARSMRGDEK